MTTKKIFSPFQKFVKKESFSGILLLIFTILALLWSNSPFSESYQSLWQYKIGFKLPYFELYKPLLLWINDGLMAIFFFLIGLEIKREFLIGELNTLKKIAFPLSGALGGMSFPVIFFFILNNNQATADGWGIPMATDIAFALTILKLLGKRVPMNLKIFLTAFAIVDDIGSVLAIAIFYSDNINITLLIIALLLLIFLYILSYKGLYFKFIILMLGIIIWLLFLKSGIHPTLAGILIAFSIPVRQKIDTAAFVNRLAEITKNIQKATVFKKPMLSKEQIVQIDEIEYLIDKYQSPLQHLEHRLHDWVAYLILPLFALANGGVTMSSDIPLDTSLISTVIIALILGNSIGISFIVLTAGKLNIISIPKDISTRHIVGVSFLAGIGFTMAIFIAGLAFKDNKTLIDSAKIGILIGSFTSAIIGYLILRFTTKKSIP